MMGKYKYTDEELISLAKSFTSLQQFKCCHRKQYENLMKRGLNRYVVSEKDSYDIVMRKRNNIIYAYEDPDNRYVYVGRTYNKLRYRHKDHNRIVRKTGKYDNVKRYFIGIGKELPKPKVLKDNLSTEESQYYEEYFCKEYVQNGWTLINKAKVGIGSSSIGGYYLKYTEKYVKEYLETNHIEYRKDICSRVMDGIRRNHLEYLIDDIPEKPLNKYSSYSKDEILLLCSDSYNMSEILEKDKELYDYIHNNDEFSEFVESLKYGRRPKYDVETAVEIAKRYKSRNQLKKENITVFKILKKENLIDGIFYQKYDNTPKRIVQIDPETNSIVGVYEGVIPTAKLFGKRDTGLRDTLNGRQNTWCGYIWRYEK